MSRIRCSLCDADTLEHDHVRCDIPGCPHVQFVPPGSAVRDGWSEFIGGLHSCSTHGPRHADAVALHLAFPLALRPRLAGIMPDGV